MESLITALRRMHRADIGLFPTPLHRMKRLEKDLGVSPVFIKRDDMTGVGPGGNKIRSLEFILGDAVQKSCDSIIVYGPPQSNLCTLTACACAKLGLKCITVHDGERPKTYNGNLLLNRLLDVEARYVGNVSWEERNQIARELVEELKAQGKKPYIIENGATTGTGALGYVSFCVELYKQAQEQNLHIKTIFAPGGNGGIATGLIYGSALLGVPFEIVIISVEFDACTLKDNILRTISEAEQVLGLQFPCRLEDVCRIADDYRGGGWSVNTVESERFVQRLPQLEGVFIENIYTSKVLVGMEDFLKKGLVKDGACYLHTGGGGSLFSQY